MYTMRVDAERRLLSVECRGRLTTEEALRAVSQAFTLAEAGNIRGVICDLAGVHRGPGGLLIVAAAFASRFQPSMRVAFVGSGARLDIARRFIRFSGVRNGLRAFGEAGEASAWLNPVLRRPKPRLSTTELRHAQEMVGAVQGAIGAGVRRQAPPAA